MRQIPGGALGVLSKTATCLIGDRGDCANFVSQIMNAGGFRENADWSYNAGRPTRSWSVANDLANRFGVTRKTTSLSVFTSRAVVGRPVGAHNGTRVYRVGYVMGKGGYATYRGVSYRVLTIAQHSSNYYGSMDGGAASGWRSESTWVTP
ncbi:amidase domain-containing protein [Trueperella sp.]|uniref:amidase domain-containing protein n=1 Tax=Trueperella sp. TaxID=2699835 RepID=UPI00344D9994